MQAEVAGAAYHVTSHPDQNMNYRDALRVGSDCCGLAVEMLALKQCGENAVLEFASEKDPVFRQAIKDRYPDIKALYADCGAR